MRKAPSGMARSMPAVAAVGAAALVLLLVVQLWLSRAIGPDKVAGRMEAVLGAPVAVEAVEVSLLRREAVIRGLELAPSGRIESATLGLDVAAAFEGKMRFRGVDIVAPVWTLPRSPAEVEVFVKALMIPLALATRSNVVTLSEGSVVGAVGGRSIATDVGGEMKGVASGSVAGVEAALTARISGVGEVSAGGLCLVSARGDSLEVRNLQVSALGLRLEGSAGASSPPRLRAHAELATLDFHGGALSGIADLEQRADGPFVITRFVLKDVDGAALLRDRFGVGVLESGRLNGNLALEGAVLAAGGARDLSAEGEVTVDEAVLDSNGLVSALIPVAPRDGSWAIERGTARFEISRTGIVVRDMRIDGGDLTWTGSGRIRFDGEVSGTLLGRVPAELMSGKGTALALVAAMLADRSGRIPAAFSVTGSLTEPRVTFDLDATAEAAAAAGRPEAKRLLRAMSRPERERYGRMVDEYLRGLRGP